MAGRPTRQTTAASDPTTITPVVTVADLAVSKSHSGNFKQGDAADTYTITVSNVAGSGPTTGLVTVSDTLPTGLSPTAADNGTIAGWSVSYVGQTVTATRSDVLAGGASYPALAHHGGRGEQRAGERNQHRYGRWWRGDNTTNNSASDPTTITSVASKVAFTAQPRNVAVGTSISPAVQVSIEDANGNVVTGDTSTVTLTLSSGTFASGSNTATAVASGGVATFGSLSINTAGTGYTLTATGRQSYRGHV